MTTQTTGRLTEQYGAVLPPGLIAAAVESASRHAPDEDPHVVERAARADLEALADAVRRAPARDER